MDHRNTTGQLFLRCALILFMASLIALETSARSMAQIREIDTDRPGADYKAIPLDASFCESECKKDPQCKAWTFVKPGTTQGPDAHCWLKKSLPAPVKDTCCISGYKSGLPPVSTSGDLAAVDWCYVVNVNETEIKFLPIVRNVGPTAWASAKEGYYKIGVGAGPASGPYTYVEENRKLLAFPYFWLEKDTDAILSEGITVAFHTNRYYSLDNIWILHHTEDTNAGNNALLGKIGIFPGTVFLPTGNLYGKRCKF